MTIALFLLAAVTPCAVPTLCPTRKELIWAINRYAEENIPIDQVPKDAIWVPTRILGLSDIVCGDEIPGAPGSMNCKYTVRYAGDTSYEIATLVRRYGIWAITDKHAVWRKR